MIAYGDSRWLTVENGDGEETESHEITLEAIMQDGLPGALDAGLLSLGYERVGGWETENDKNWEVSVRPM